jgi:hypothetical protein
MSLLSKNKRHPIIIVMIFPMIINKFNFCREGGEGGGEGGQGGIRGVEKKEEMN